MRARRCLGLTGTNEHAAVLGAVGRCDRVEILRTRVRIDGDEYRRGAIRR